MPNRSFAPLTSECFLGRADVADATSIAAILSDATQFKVKHGDLSWGSGAWTEQKVLSDMASSEMYIVRREGAVVATLCLQWDDLYYWGTQPPVAGYLHRLAVREGFHGSSIGAWAIDWAARQVILRGRNLLRLDCDSANTSLCGYYERQGFARVGQKILRGNYVAALYERAIET
jgi:GNAT superfamily N-acetyltransferase